jgi:hypothetical protein
LQSGIIIIIVVVVVVKSFSTGGTTDEFVDSLKRMGIDRYEVFWLPNLTT